MLESSSRFISGADEENRTPVISLEGWGSTIELHPQLVDNINYTIFWLFVNRTPPVFLIFVDFVK